MKSAIVFLGMTLIGTLIGISVVTIAVKLNPRVLEKDRWTKTEIIQMIDEYHKVTE